MSTRILSPFLCVYMHGSLSKCLQTEDLDQTGCGRDRCRDIFKSLYKNKRENVWATGWVEEIMACPGVFGTKTTQKSTFFKMSVSLSRPRWERYYTDK